MHLNTHPHTHNFTGALVSAGFEVSARVGPEPIDGHLQHMESIGVDDSTTKSESNRYVKHHLHRRHHDDDTMDDWMDVISPNEL